MPFVRVTSLGGFTPAHTTSSGRRDTGRQSDGTLWKAVSDNSNTYLWYSKNSGKSWTQSSHFWGQSVGLFIDSADNMHVLTGPRGPSQFSQTNYQFGTPNVDRTAFSFGSAFTVGSGYSGVGDIVAHPNADVSGGWIVHTLRYVESGSLSFTPLQVAANGTVSFKGSNYSMYSGSATHMSIDFKHTGDGVTPASSYPDVYIVGSSSIASPQGTYYRRHVGSTTGWDAGTGYQLNATDSGPRQSAIFDGANFWVFYCPSSTQDLYLAKCPAAGGAATVYGPLTKPAGVGTVSTSGGLAITNLGTGVVYLAWSPAAGGLYYCSFTASNSTQSAWSAVDMSNTEFMGDSPTLARGAAYGLDFGAYGRNSGANYYYGMFNRVVVNTQPTVTITTTPGTKFDPRLTRQVAWSVSNGTQAKYQVSWRNITGAWTDLAAVTSAATSHTFTANTFPDVADVEVRVRVFDEYAWSEWASVPLRSDSWTYLADIMGTAASTNVATTGWLDGTHEVEVATADFTGFGAYGQDTTVASTIQVESGSAALSGSGSLTVPTRVPAPVQTVGLSGSGTLTFPTRIVGVSGSGALSGSGTLVGTGAPKPIQTAALTGSGTLTGVRTYTVVSSAWGGSASGTGWVNTANAIGADDGTFASWTTSTGGAVSEHLIVSGFGTFADLPGDSFNPKITVRVKGYTSHE
jgi:hypothetical protein